ncbi:MAG TPA: GTPase ObgE [Solirubrobacteraceae bacterium]|nr:GTPase ObgE [Solirubrobacteraceae bacterium]
MLHDKAKVYVRAGAGGDGCISFRREAHVPKGGPDGGDGGHGGDVVFVCDDSLRDLRAFRRRSRLQAERGRHGEGARRSGADGSQLEVRVAPGTRVVGLDGARFDLIAPGQRAVVARGGAGGRGNKRFASPTRQTPRFGELGLPGEEGWVELSLKLLADVGLVGLPNAGKSSLLARLTRASPKVADYPFTTIEPVLGALQGEDSDLILADIPGLIEGASDGAGLGHEFLAHIERTRLIVHVVELVPLDGSDPIGNFTTVEGELERHDPQLAALPRVLVLSKADLVTEQAGIEAAAEWSRRLPEIPVLLSSSATGAGVAELGRELLRRVPPREATPRVADSADGALAEHRVFRPGSGRDFTVERVGDSSFRVSGASVERLLARHDLANDEALAHIEGRLRSLGVIRALEAKGFEPGDDVEIAGLPFELD